MLAVLLPLFDLIWQDTIVFACSLVDLALLPGPLALALEFITASAELGDGLFGEQLFERPLLNVLLLVLFQLSNELNSAL